MRLSSFGHAVCMPSSMAMRTACPPGSHPLSDHPATMTAMVQEGAHMRHTELLTHGLHDLQARHRGKERGLGDAMDLLQALLVGVAWFA
jgi:hypothetical protein